MLNVYSDMKICRFLPFGLLAGISCIGPTKSAGLLGMKNVPLKPTPNPTFERVGGFKIE